MWRAAGACTAAPRSPVSADKRRRLWLPQAAAAGCGAVLVAISPAADRQLVVFSDVLRRGRVERGTWEGFGWFS